MGLSGFNINLASVMPEILTTGLAIVVMVLDFFLDRKRKYLLGYLSIIGLLLILPVAVMTAEKTPSFGGTVMSDAFSAYFNVIFIISAVFTTLISVDYLKKTGLERGEYYYIILFATVGMMVMTSANDLINFYVGLELMALSFYILVAYRIGSSRSVEGALKYFVLGALSSGILLYGITFAYGATGSTNLNAIAAGVGGAEGPFLTLGFALIAVGFGFKVAAFPFHLWAPDVYEGAPTPVTAFLSIGSKAAAFAAFLRIFIVAFPGVQDQWSGMLWLLSAATMIFGSVAAISQKNIVRMLAYSSIAHAGIILIGFLIYSDIGTAGVMYYLLVYLFMNMGAFAVVAHLRDGKKGAVIGEKISDYRGLVSQHPILALLMALFIFSLAGIPPTGGFVAKFVVLSAAISAKYYWLASIGVATTVISLFFYAKVIFYMFMKESEVVSELPGTGVCFNIVLFCTAVGTIFLGIYPTPFIDLAMKAVKPFFM
ncbi:MAG: NADH-quinone oxidoreductase subunit N [Thermodesulfobacteriota bacterium]|nr:MAG: NADH-quinone oxidoreductase subunit N [Thermodesulfobacteriota bacterium]